MYNKTVTTLVILAVFALASPGHAQYYSSYYGSYAGAPISQSFGYANTRYAGTSSAFGANYFGQWMGPTFGPPTPKTPSNFNFAYNSLNFAPVFAQPSYTPSSFTFDARPVPINPTYGMGGGGGLGNINLNFQPLAVNPTYGGGSFNGFGNLQFNLAPREIPNYGQGLGFGAVRYNFAANQYAVPIYATPSRALFNTEFAFGTTYNPFYYY